MSSVIILMMLWVMMNLVLVNLLIAMMSNTYQRVESQSQRQWMIDLYHLVKECSRFSLTVPAPFNLLWIIGELLLFLYWLWDGRLDILYPDMGWRMKLRYHISRNMSTARLLKERQSVNGEKERQKLMSFMERARIKWREVCEALPLQFCLSSLPTRCCGATHWTEHLLDGRIRGGEGRRMPTQAMSIRVCGYPATI